MIVEKVGNRGVLFTFEEGDSPFEENTSTYLINADDRIFICDTHVGPKSMDIIKQYIDNNNLKDKEIIVFNSHADWDHIWGNCAFKDATIIAHKLCRRIIEQEGDFELKRKKKYHNGLIELKMPNLTFDSKLNFEDDEIEFIYAPGHTIDSSICFDRKDSVVFVGDLLEYPIPYTYYHELKAYLKTLEFIKSLSAKTILSAHSGIIDEKLFTSNMEYIKKLLKKNPIEVKDEDYLSYHNSNLKSLLISEYQCIVEERLGEKYDFESFRRQFWSSVDIKSNNLELENLYMRDISCEELEEALKNYVSQM